MKSIGDDSAEDNITNQSQNDALNRTNNIGISRPPMLAQSPKDLKKVRPFRAEGKTISSQRILLFEKKTKIGKKDYLVEISRDKLHMFIIAFLIENPKYFTLQIPMKQAFKLLLDLDNSFDALIDLLYFSFGSLVLPDILRPKFSPRNMTHYSQIKTTTHKNFNKFKGFGSNSNSKATISNATPSRPILYEENGSKESLEEGKDTKEQEVKELEKDKKEDGDYHGDDFNFEE